MSEINAAAELRACSTGVSVSIHWWGLRKTLNTQQKEEAANVFGASHKLLSASKCIIDAKHPAMKRLTKVRNEINRYWHNATLPYVEAGTRLLRRDDYNDFNDTLVDLGCKMTEGVENLKSYYPEILQQAKMLLGELYDAGDYPTTLDGLFGLQWEPVEINPPEWLKAFNPSLYEEQCRKVEAKFERAVHLAEEAFAEEFGKLVNHLLDRLQPNPDGTPKVFQKSTVDNFNDFFTRFRHLNVSNSTDLENLVTTAEQLVNKNDVTDLRISKTLREEWREKLAAVGNSLSPMIQNAPRRKIQMADQPALMEAV